MALISNILSQLLLFWSQLYSQIFPQYFQVDSNCNYSQDMTPGVNYYVYNKEYPSNYQPSEHCRWILVAPQGYQVSLNCSINLQWSTGCLVDKLLISTSGNVNLVNPNTYCGKGNMSLLSTNNVLVIGFKSGRYTRGGTYLCSATTYSTSTTSSTTTSSTTTSPTTSSTTTSSTTTSSTTTSVSPSTTSTTTTASISSTPTQPFCDCGWNVNSDRIVGGVETEVNEFPSMAALIDLLINDEFCGATIIAETYALTAAHCLINKQVTAVGMLVGDQNISAALTTPGAEFILIYQFIRHPGFNESDPLNQNDIAILRTETPMVFSNSIGPACLPFAYSNDLFTGQTAIFAGWGTTEFMGPKSDVLLKTDVTVVSPAVCTNETDSNLNQVCTYTPGKDACQADSGGPLYWTEPNTNRDQLIGIISTGIGCATTTPSVNTRVTAYLDWIVQNTPDASYCVS